MTLYLFNFNNYYNRIIKKYDKIDDYGTPLETFTNVNFNPNDGISTKQILNYNGDIPDYLIAHNGKNIESRWFILDAVRTRAQQFEVSLYRDVIADWYDDIVKAPVFIERATLSSGNPLLYNSENVVYNQIKTSEAQLKDKSNIPWIVGYVDKNWSGTVTVGALNVDVDYTLTSLDEYQYNDYTMDSFLVPYAKNYRWNWFNNAGNLPSKQSYSFVWDDSGNSVLPLNPNDTYVQNYIYKINNSKSVGYPYLLDSDSYETTVNTYVKPFINSKNWKSYNSSNYISGLKTETDLELLLNENGKIIKVNNDYYKVNVITNQNTSVKNGIPKTSSLGLIMNELESTLKLPYIISRTEPGNSPWYEIEAFCYNYNILYEKISVVGIQVNIPSDRLHSQFLPYDIFCIPYGEITVNNNKLIKDYGLRLANEIIRNAGDNLYDIQLLPYCPLQDRLTSGLSIIDGNGDDYLKAETEIYSAIFWVDNPNFSFEITTNKIDLPTSNIEIKVSNECDFYRLTSPNYNGQFEFSAAKNGGVNKYQVDCSYKPFTPYIKISPQFSGLYGQDFNDARGLICGGDFSLTQSKDAWIQYQIQNKNFQEMFDREIQNMDVINSITRIQEKWNIRTGVVGGVLNGSIAGGMSGNPYAMAGGAIAGGVASLAGGIMDYRLNEQIREETKSYKIDQFNYSLGNVKALPTSLTKVSAFNTNNKIFPILEYYTCTNTEKEALRNKIKYEGMNVGVVGTISEYLQNEPSFIKCSLIRLEISEDFHVVNMISKELLEGVYI